MWSAADQNVYDTMGHLRLTKEEGQPIPYAMNPDDGLQIYYEVEGDGPPVLMLHGITVSSRMWRRWGYVEALKNDYRLILVDTRGHGRSGKPQTQWRMAA